MKMKIGQLAACVFIAAAAMAQVNTSSIFGRVTDSTGASIAMLRAELTNAFNLVNLGNPNLTLTSNIFGHISTGNADAARSRWACA